MSTVLIAVIAFILGGNMGILLMCIAQTSAEAERSFLYNTNMNRKSKESR